MNEEMLREDVPAVLPGVTVLAREKLRGFWNQGALFSLVCFLLLLGVSALCHFMPLLTGVSSILSGIIGLAYSYWALSFYRTGEINKKAFEFAFRRLGVAIWAAFVMGIYIFLWTLLLIIPGILAILNYSMTLFVLSEDRNISIGDAIRRSKKMMYGHRWKLFVLNLYFWLLAIGALFTLGIGFFWLVPYMYVTYAAFYERIKPQSEEDLPEYPGMSIGKTVLICIVLMLLGAMQGYGNLLMKQEQMRQQHLITTGPHHP